MSLSYGNSKRERGKQGVEGRNSGAPRLWEDVVLEEKIGGRGGLVPLAGEKYFSRNAVPIFQNTSGVP